MRQRLQTCDIMQMWNVAINTTCVLYKEANEICHHLFFNCNYSKHIWIVLAGGILQRPFLRNGMISSRFFQTQGCHLQSNSLFDIPFKPQSTHYGENKMAVSMKNNHKLQVSSLSLWIKQLDSDYYWWRGWCTNILKRD